MNTKEIFESVLTVPIMKKLWTANYQPAIPFTPQDYEIGSIMPAILYMFRWGHRRGKGKFIDQYGSSQKSGKNYATIDGVSEILSNRDEFIGFDCSVSKAILGDMLLASCLENKKHLIGRTEQIQRAYPTHYLASWIDLPQKVSHLRFVPEMLIGLLVKQEHGESILRSNRRNHFSVGAGFDDNILLSLLGNGMEIRGNHRTDLTSDTFDEASDDVGIDQLLTIRIAQGCGEAPVKARGSGEAEEIQNQWPIAKTAATTLREDFSVFVQAYGKTIPRQTFLQMLESCLSLGLSNIYFSTIGMLSEWEQTGKLPDMTEQKPLPFFVDCSVGGDRQLRRSAEESMSHFFRHLYRLPEILMCMRIIESKIKTDRQLRDKLPSSCPDATDFLNLLGEIYKEDHSRSQIILEKVDESCLQIADALEDNGIDQELRAILRSSLNPVNRLSEALCILMGGENLLNQYAKFLNSTLMTDLPNGLAQKRRASPKTKSGKNARFDVRSIVLTNPMLDFIVHRHLRKAAKGKGAKTLTFLELIRILKERYGLYVNESPPGMTIPVEMLLHNKRILERRLRDLGVLVGVNDAESMKRLRQRFSAAGDEECALSRHN